MLPVHRLWSRCFRCFYLTLAQTTLMLTFGIRCVLCFDQSNENIQHPMNALQTHSMLSGLHLHLTVTRKTCPVCNGIDLMEYVGQFCVSVKSQTQFGMSNLYAQLHKSEKPFPLYSWCLENANDGIPNSWNTR